MWKKIPFATLPNNLSQSNVSPATDLGGVVFTVDVVEDAMGIRSRRTFCKLDIGFEDGWDTNFKQSMVLPGVDPDEVRE